MKYISILLTTVLGCILINLFSGCTVNNAEESHTFIELMKLIPAESAENKEFVLINYSKIWDDAKIIFPKDKNTGTNQEIISRILSITKPISGNSAFEFSSFYSGLDGTLAISPISYDTLGYYLVVDVDAEIIHINSNDNDLMIGMKGNFNTQSTKDALQKQDGWPQWARDNFIIEQYLDTSIYSWGKNEDNHFKDSYLPPHLDVGGIARPFTVHNGSMQIGHTVAIVKRMIDAFKGESESLADIPEYTLIAEQMDSLVVYAVVISTTMTTNEYFQLLLPIQSFQAVGFGDGKDERGEYTAVVAIYQNDELAKENFGILKETWEILSDELGAEAVPNDIQRYGRVLRAKLYIEGNPLGIEWLNIAGTYTS